MKQNHGYEIDFSENQIIVTKHFLKEAGIIGSPAYTELAQVRSDFPDFRIVPREITKKPDKKTYGKLTYEAMKEFITALEEDNAPTVLAEFDRIQQLSAIHSGPYAFVKAWFLKRYKDVFEKKEETAEAMA